MCFSRAFFEILLSLSFLSLSLSSNLLLRRLCFPSIASLSSMCTHVLPLGIPSPLSMMMCAHLPFVVWFLLLPSLFLSLSLSLSRLFFRRATTTSSGLFFSVDGISFSDRHHRGLAFALAACSAASHGTRAKRTFAAVAIRGCRAISKGCGGCHERCVSRPPLSPPPSHPPVCLILLI